MVYAGFDARTMREVNGVSRMREISGFSKDCLNKVNKYNIPHLKVSLQEFFQKWLDQTKTFPSFDNGTIRMDTLNPSLSRFFCFSICSRDPMNVQTNVSQVASMIALSKMIAMFRSSNLSSSFPHYLAYYTRKAFRYLWRKWLCKFLSRE